MKNSKPNEDTNNKTNTQPHYDIKFIKCKSRKKALKLLNKLAKENTNE